MPDDLPANRARAFAALEYAAARIEGPLTTTAYDELGITPSTKTIIREFGSWRASLEAAGLMDRLYRGMGGWYTDGELLDAVREVAAREDRGGPLRQTRYESLRDEVHPTVVTISSRFGGFVAARELALEEGEE